MKQCGVAEHVKSNVLKSIRDIPTMLHHIFQSIPPPPGILPEESVADSMVPPNFDPGAIFDDLSFEAVDGFDFKAMNDDALLSFEYSSASSTSGDTAYPPASSATSVEDSHGQQQHGMTNLKKRQAQGGLEQPVQSYYASDFF